jgi:hypothetical protein
MKKKKLLLETHPALYQSEQKKNGVSEDRLVPHTVYRPHFPFPTGQEKNNYFS